MTLLETTARPPQARLARGLRIAAASAALGASLGLSAAAVALGLGDIVQQSALGEPFRATIGVIASAEDMAGDELAPECLRLVGAESERSTDLPQLVFGRAALARNADGLYVVVTSGAIANDPALSFTVQAGCRVRTRREYTVLLDPPIAREPAAASAPSGATVLRGRNPSSGETTQHVASATKPPSAQRSRRSLSRGATRPARASASVPQPKADGTAPATRSNVEPRPRLSVSRSDGAGATGRKKTDAEIRHELEAETVVLQRRIAELSLTLARLDEQLRAARAVRDAAERSAKAPAPRPSDTAFWLLPASLLALGLALVAMMARALRRPTLRSIGLSPLIASTLGPGHSETPGREPSRSHRAVPPPSADGLDDPTRGAAAPTPPRHDDEVSFDDDVIRYAAQRSAYSALEREHPRVMTAVVREWGRRKVIAYLRDLLVSARRAPGGFSREAVSDLVFLQAIAMERAGYRADDHPWRIELAARRRA